MGPFISTLLHVCRGAEGAPGKEHLKDLGMQAQDAERLMDTVAEEGRCLWLRGYTPPCNRQPQTRVGTWAQSAAQAARLGEEGTETATRLVSQVWTTISRGLRVAP